MVEIWQTTIPTLSGEVPRSVYVYLPLNYAKSHASYPVLYLFDGQEVFSQQNARFGSDFALDTFLDANHVPLIVVAVACNADVAGARLDEYSPFDFSHKVFGDHIGKGKQTMDWYVHTLKPKIDSLYRTLPDRAHTYIMGCSMGGLMSLYALLEYNSVFHGAAALSPSLWVAPAPMRALIRTAHIDPDTILYMDCGQIEMKQQRSLAQLFPDFSKALENRGVLLTQRIVPGGKHSSESWKHQLPFVLFTLLYAESF